MRIRALITSIHCLLVFTVSSSVAQTPASSTIVQEMVDLIKQEEYAYAEEVARKALSDLEGQEGASREVALITHQLVIVLDRQDKIEDPYRDQDVNHDLDRTELLEMARESLSLHQTVFGEQSLETAAAEVLR